MLQESLDLYRRLGDRGGEGAALHRLANVACQQDRQDEGARLFEEVLAVFTHTGEKRGIARALNALGNLAWSRGDLEEARRLLGEALSVMHDIEDRQGIAMVLNNIGLVALDQGRLDEARALVEEGLALDRQLGILGGIARGMMALGEVARVAGDPDAARARYEEALDFARRFELKMDESDAIYYLERIGAPPEAKVWQPPVPPPMVAGPAIFREDAKGWLVGFEGASFRLKPTKGLRYIAQLLAHPEREFHALDLAAADAGAERAHAYAAMTDDQLGELGLHRDRLGDAGELLDADAKAAYRRRLDDLREEIEEAEAWDDAGRAAVAREEMERIISELVAALGIGGRDRKAASSAERARVAVTKAIKSAVQRLGEESESLGLYLSCTIRTGTFCSYTPDPRIPVSWELEARS
jgi:non-specific serine/threonine protein kinase